MISGLAGQFAFCFLLFLFATTTTKKEATINPSQILPVWFLCFLVCVREREVTGPWSSS